MYWIRIHSNISNMLEPIQPQYDFIRLVSQSHNMFPKAKCPLFVFAYFLFVSGCAKCVP
jgi:hypothetical protein